MASSGKSAHSADRKLYKSMKMRHQHASLPLLLAGLIASAATAAGPNAALWPLATGPPHGSSHLPFPGPNATTLHKEFIYRVPGTGPEPTAPRVGGLVVGPSGSAYGVVATSNGSVANVSLCGGANWSVALPRPDGASVNVSMQLAATSDASSNGDLIVALLSDERGFSLTGLADDGSILWTHATTAVDAVASSRLGITWDGASVVHVLGQSNLLGVYSTQTGALLKTLTLGGTQLGEIFGVANGFGRWVAVQDATYVLLWILDSESGSPPVLKFAHGLQGAPRCTTPMLLAMGGESDSMLIVAGLSSATAYAVNGGPAVWSIALPGTPPSLGIAGAAFVIENDLLLLSITSLDPVSDPDYVTAYSLSTGLSRATLVHPATGTLSGGLSVFYDSSTQLVDVYSIGMSWDFLRGQRKQHSSSSYVRSLRSHGSSSQNNDSLLQNAYPVYLVHNVFDRALNNFTAAYDHWEVNGGEYYWKLSGELAPGPLPGGLLWPEGDGVRLLSN